MTDFMSSIAVRVCMACFSVLALSVFIFEAISASPIQVLKGKDGDAISPVSNKYIETIVDVTVGDSYANSAYAMFGALTEKGSLYIWGYDNVHPSGDSELSILTPIKSKFQTELKAISLGNAGGNDTQWLLGTGAVDRKSVV